LRLFVVALRSRCGQGSEETVRDMDTWIIADSDQLAARIRESLRHLAIECPPTRITRIDSIGPQADVIAEFDGLVFFAAQHIDPAHIEVLRQIRSVVNNDAKLVVISSVGDHGTVLNAIRAGASDFLNVDDNLHEELINFVTRTKSERKNKHVQCRVLSVVPCHAPGDANLVAANLAAVVAKRMGSCGLLDFHLRGGDLALLLKLSPRHTLIDLLKQDMSIDEAMFEQSLTPHESGIRLLAGPKPFSDLRNIRPQLCQQIISLAQRSHPFLIINSEDAQHAEQVRALANSNDILLTMRLDVISLHRAQQHIEFMTHNRVLREQIHIVALGTGNSGELPISSVKKVLQMASVHCIPDDPGSTMRSLNVGNPLVCECPNTKISQALAALAEVFVGQPEEIAKPSARPPMATVKAAAIIALSTLPFGK
jgi:pilus assembly protein CpaE